MKLLEKIKLSCADKYYCRFSGIKIGATLPQDFTSSGGFHFLPHIMCHSSLSAVYALAERAKRSSRAQSAVKPAERDEPAGGCLQLTCGGQKGNCLCAKSYSSHEHL